MSVNEIILTRAMSEPEFADLLFSDPEKALADYGLTTEELELFTRISRTEFETLAAEDRKSLGLGIFKIDAAPR